MSLNEFIIEEATLEWFEGQGYACKNGLLIAPGEPSAERDSFGDVALVGRFREAIWRLNMTQHNAPPSKSPWLGLIRSLEHRQERH